VGYSSLNDILPASLSTTSLCSSHTHQTVLNEISQTQQYNAEQTDQSEWWDEAFADSTTCSCTCTRPMSTTERSGTEGSCTYHKQQQSEVIKSTL
jgi:hypothetical protein